MVQGKTQSKIEKWRVSIYEFGQILEKQQAIEEGLINFTRQGKMGSGELQAMLDQFSPVFLSKWLNELATELDSLIRQELIPFNLNRH